MEALTGGSFKNYSNYSCLIKSKLVMVVCSKVTLCASKNGNFVPGFERNSSQPN